MPIKIPVPPPAHDDLFQDLLSDGQSPERFQRVLKAAIGPAPKGRYRHWHKLRHLEPPEGLSQEEWWLGVKLARLHLSQPLPLRATDGEPFHYAMLDIAYRMLHQIDSDARGHIGGSEQVTNPQTRDRYLFNSLIEEAITSSQLEGAATTREVAKAMIQQGRKPRNHGERMILNNYEGMRRIRELRGTPLSVELLLELHRVFTADTLEPSEVGRFRRDEDNVCVMDEVNTILHRPPRAGELPQRIQAMCDFANAEETDRFIHPVVRAILLHFWLAYDHPFVDGNGRTARALFYWSMARSGYWICEYLSISSIIKKAPARYSRAFLYTETDENDVTYFILNQLNVVIRAIEELHKYLKRKQIEVKEAADMIRRSERLRGTFNHRQLALLSHALKHPSAVYTIESHRASHGVTYPTARADLLQLAEEHVLDQYKMGRAFSFVAPADLRERLARLE